MKNKGGSTFQANGTLDREAQAQDEPGVSEEEEKCQCVSRLVCEKENTTRQNWKGSLINQGGNLGQSKENEKPLE